MTFTLSTTVFLPLLTCTSLGFRLHISSEHRHRGQNPSVAWHAAAHGRPSAAPDPRRKDHVMPCIASRCSQPEGSVIDATLVQEREEVDLFDSFPKIRQLPRMAPMERWNSTKLRELPPETFQGVLENGLTYFVQENPEPQARAELFLVVGFGSLVEQEEERGIAHIIEHLGFSATKAYENFAIIKFLESIGAPFGACQNAYTGFDRTVYTLKVPTDKESILNESLTVLREFAFFTRISDEDLEKERTVVLEEWRQSLSATGRLTQSYFSALAKGAKYPERLPIGTVDVIKNVKAETLREFYAKFYHPARMAVVAVGDFDGKAVVETIESLFNIAPQDISPLPRVPVAAVPERPWFDVPDSEGVVVASMIDPELRMPQAIVNCKQRNPPLKTLDDCRRSIREGLFYRAFNARLTKLILEPKGTRNLFQASVSSANPIPPLSPMTIGVSPVPGRMRYAMQDVVRELERVKRFGFHETEILRAKKSMLAGFEQAYIERDQTPSDSLAEEYVSYFLEDEPVPGITEEASMAVTVVPFVTRAEISAVAAQFDFQNNVVVKIATPPFPVRNLMWSSLQALRHFKWPRSKMDLPDDDEVAALLRGVQGIELEQWPEDEDDASTRLQRKFDSEAKRLPSLSSNIGVSTSERRAVHVKRMPKVAGTEDSLFGEELILQNGLRVFLKDTNLSDDQILVAGQRWGGLTKFQSSGWLGMANGALTPEAKACAEIAPLIGACGMPSELLAECLDGKRCEPGFPAMSVYATNFGGATSPADLECLLTVMNLIFVCQLDPSRTDKRRLALYRRSMIIKRLASRRDPMTKFQQQMMKRLTLNHPAFRPQSLLRLLGCNFKKASAIFNEISSTPEEWTFTFVGKLPNKDVFIPLLEKYLGTIPTKRNVAADVDHAERVARRSEMELRKAIVPLSVSFPAKPLREEVRLKMVEQRGVALIAFPISLSTIVLEGKPETAKEELEELQNVGFLEGMINTRLVEVLRFQRGQVYSVSVNTDFSTSAPLPGLVRNGQLRISFECNPAEADEIVDAALEELARLRNGSSVFSDGDVAAVLENDRRRFEEEARSNDFWCGFINNLYFSRAFAVIGDIGEAVELWMGAREAALAGFTAAFAQDTFRTLLPEGVSSAIITLKPKRSWLAGIKGRLQPQGAKERIQTS